MSMQAVIRGPCLRLLTFGVLLAAALPNPALAQQAAVDPAPQSQVTTEQEPRTGFFSEPRLIRKSMNWVADFAGDGSGTPKDGFFVEFSNMLTGAGWISAGPGYRHTLFNRHAIAETSASLSWRMYKMAQGRFEFVDLANNHLSVGTQLMWRDMTQVQYFGLGPESDESFRSQYRMRTTNWVGYAKARPKEWLTIGGDLGWLKRPELGHTAGSFKRDLPESHDAFPADPAVNVDAIQPNFLHGGLSIVADTRDHRSHPTSGGMYRAAWTTYRDQGAGRFTFDRYEAEAAHFVPLADQRIVFAFHGWTAVSTVAADRDVPVYLMPSLGGKNTLRAYSDYRFHDRNLVVVTAESRFAVFRHVDLAAFFDAGNVAHRASDLNFDKHDYGIGIRLHNLRSTLARLDIARGDGGWKFAFSTNDPLHLTRVRKSTAAAPFVP